MTDDHRIDAENRAVRDALRALADAERGLEASSAVEAAVMSRWDAAHAAPPRRRRAIAWAAPMAAGVVFGFLWLPDRAAPLRRPEPQPVLARREAPLQETTPVVRPTVDEDGIRAAGRRPRRAARLAGKARPRETVMLVGGPLLSNEALHVVRMRVDRDTLTSMGLRSVSSPDAAMVDVEMLVGEDGVARALRVGM